MKSMVAAALVGWGWVGGALAAPPRIDRTVPCEVLIVGGGLAGSGAAYEALLAGRTVCLTDITDWLGGQISAQGTSALDERATQRERLFFDRGYLELRNRIRKRYGRQNPGGCWVSASCFFPKDGHEILLAMLRDAERQGGGKLHWLPNTVIKDMTVQGRAITGAIAITHRAKEPNVLPLSQVLPEAYRYEDAADFQKTIVQLQPLGTAQPHPWYVIEATETGELIGLLDLPHRLGIDRRSHLEPSSSSGEGDEFCTQGFTYTLAMAATATPQVHTVPDFYARFAPYYSYELTRLASFPLVFTYRRIFTPTPERFENFPFADFKRDDAIVVGDISMQNWTWGNDYRPGTSQDNLILNRDQLRATGQRAPGGWQGGLRVSTLAAGELHAKGFFYWLATGTTDSQLGDGVKKPYPNLQYLRGVDSPMGTAHGLSKYPYMREGRRIIGRPGWGHPEGFTIWELDISRRDFSDPFYRANLAPEAYRRMQAELTNLERAAVLRGEIPPEAATRRTRSTIYPDAVGIGHYAIDFHPCMAEYPVEKPGNQEREGERFAQGQAYPFQIPLRALIPQNLDNLLVAGKSMATSHIAAAAYRVHSFEWSSGVAAGTAIDFAFREQVAPFQLVENLPRENSLLTRLRQQLERSGNPTAFPDTSIFNVDWEAWR